MSFNMSDDDSHSDSMSTIPDPTKFARLKELTDDMVDCESLDSAIADGNEDELVSTHNKVKWHNDKVNIKIPGDQAHAIDSRCDCETSSVKWSTVCWHRNHFHIREIVVQLGNCPQCHRAMPVGMPFPLCSSLTCPRRASHIHFANDIDIFQEGAENMCDLTSEGWPHAHATELSWKTLGLEPIIGHTSWHCEAPNTRCEVLYEPPAMLEVDDLLRRAKELNRHDALMPDCFKRNKAATLAEDQCTHNAITCADQFHRPGPCTPEE